jgi:hypothetical protein
MQAIVIHELAVGCLFLYCSIYSCDVLFTRREEMRQLDRRKYRWDDAIEAGHENGSYDDTVCIQVAPCNVQWQALMNLLTSLQFS